MANDLTVHPAVKEAQELLTLPPWLDSAIMSVAGQRRDMNTLDQPLTSQQRNWLQNKIEILSEKVLEQPSEEKTQNLIGSFLLAYSPINLTGDQALAKSKAFYSALREFPGWCIAEAFERWNKKQVLHEVNYAFPIPPELHQAAMDVKKCAEGRISVFKRILSFDEQTKLTDEQRKNMLTRLQTVVDNTAKKA